MHKAADGRSPAPARAVEAFGPAQLPLTLSVPVMLGWNRQ
jgi:hypothetical protein